MAGPYPRPRFPGPLVWPDPATVRVDVVPVPEPKPKPAVKNRTHLDLATSSAAHHAAVTALRRAGRRHRQGAVPAAYVVRRVRATSRAQPATATPAAPTARTFAADGASMNPPDARHDITDHREWAENNDPVLSQEPVDRKEREEPMEATDRALPIEPIDSAEPTEPTDSTEPTEPIDSTESCDQRDSTEVAEEHAGSCAFDFVFGFMGPSCPLGRTV
ncbi:hypothetical protein [Streptomyces sp. CRN 30]|uniref:hypothetical protein n=1 Tax=Streptomyces sp. CRN 30 TaxID=3075613 RepID=UPI002A832412|nr:hypothetical protein [Streptomyces sp. CRN 30]